MGSALPQFPLSFKQLAKYDLKYWARRRWTRSTGAFQLPFRIASVRVAARLRHQHKFTGRLPVRTELLDSNRLPVGIVSAREDVLVFFLGKALDDFGLGERWRRFRLWFIPIRVT